MSLEIGSQLGHYDVTALIGEGGMGQVYQATDTKLNRQVALKILPEAFASDPDRLARFQREAQVLASLNHPGIAAIHGLEEQDGQQALVLELVEGPTLADRIAKGAIPLDEALPIGKQIAEALEAAHEAGVIHRDLKPANIKVRDDGTVKVLDFGLAKALGGETDGDPSASPTLTVMATMTGVIIGTAAYMSPEQAKGRSVDKRTDVWAFSVVLFEMLAGRRPFGAGDIPETLARIIDREPDWVRLPSGTPAAVKRLLRRGLAKERRQRLPDMASARLEIDEAISAPQPGTEAPEVRPVRQRAVGLFAMGVIVLALLATGLAMWFAIQAPGIIPSVVRSSVLLPPGVAVQYSVPSVIAMSPDGSQLAYAGTDGLYLRALDQQDAKLIPGTAGALGPFFSADGQSIGFWAGGVLSRVSVSGGAPATICTCLQPYGAHWTSDDAIFFGQFQTGLWRVSASGGAPEELIPLQDGETGLVRPYLLPGGEWVLFQVAPTRSIVVQSLTTGARQVLIENGGDPRYVSTGHLVYVREGVLHAVGFDPDTRTVTGGPVPLIDGVSSSGLQLLAQYAVAETGTLVYQRGSGDQRRLVWVDRDGAEELIPMTPRRYGQPKLSPDGRRVVVGTEPPAADLFLYNLDTQVEEQFTFDPEADIGPLWSPDGRHIVFASQRHGGVFNLYAKPADGSGAAVRLTESPYAHGPWDWADDETLVLTGGALLTVRLGTEHEPILLDEALSLGMLPTFSPDRRWMAYVSSESGTPRVYVSDVDGSGRRPASDGPGTDPRWGPDGRELFYIGPEGAMVVPVVATENTFERGPARPLFPIERYHQSEGFNWDVSVDGQRFLMIARDLTAAASARELALVQNWHDELTRLVPVD